MAGISIFDPGKCCCCGFTDAFDSDTTGNYTEHTVSGTPAWAVSSGRLSVSGGTGTLYKSSAAIPAGSTGLSVVATVHSTGGGQTGVFAGNGYALVADWASGQLKRWAVDADGDTTGSVVTFSSVSDGDIISLSFTETSSGVFTVDFCVDDVRVRRETGVSLSLDPHATFNAGALGSGGEWDSLSLVCAPDICTVTCAECADEGVLEWSLTVSGITNNNCSHCNNYNGTFTLTHAGAGQPCVWGSALFGGCDDGALFGQWVLAFVFGEWRLTAHNSSGGFVVAQYDLDGAGRTLEDGLDCFGSNTFNLVFSGNPSGTQCSNLPATLTISPV